MRLKNDFIYKDWYKLDTQNILIECLFESFHFIYLFMNSIYSH